MGVTKCYLAVVNVTLYCKHSELKQKSAKVW